MFNFFKREFMLGVGAGLIISGIMVSLSGNGQMTDGEVMARAAKLGMVLKQEASQDKSVAKSQTPVTQKPKLQTPESQKPEQTSDSPVSKSVGDNTGEKVEVVTIEVRPRMGSETVIRMLEQKGAINDSDEFYKIMTKYNAHSKLKVGTFKIPAGTSMKGIVDILTSKDK